MKKKYKKKREKETHIYMTEKSTCDIHNHHIPIFHLSETSLGRSYMKEI